jgi:hypothetical protein
VSQVRILPGAPPLSSYISAHGPSAPRRGNGAGYGSSLDGTVGAWAKRSIGELPIRKLTPETLDTLYAHLRRRGGAKGRPLAASSVRQVHFILRAALGLVSRA